MKGRDTIKKENTGINIGSIIKAKLKEKRVTVVWFAAQLGTSRTNVYKIFNKHTIGTEELFKISEILNFDFFKYYSEKLGVNKCSEK